MDLLALLFSLLLLPILFALLLWRRAQAKREMQEVCSWPQIRLVGVRVFFELSRNCPLNAIDSDEGFIRML